MFTVLFCTMLILYTHCQNFVFSRYYCDSQGLPTPSGMCDPGWYSLGGAVGPQPIDAGQGGMCTAGNYCPRGSGGEIPCDPGHYCNNDGRLRFFI